MRHHHASAVGGRTAMNSHTPYTHARPPVRMHPPGALRFFPLLLSCLLAAGGTPAAWPPHRCCCCRGGCCCWVRGVRAMCTSESSVVFQRKAFIFHPRKSDSCKHHRPHSISPSRPASLHAFPPRTTVKGEATFPRLSQPGGARKTPLIHRPGLAAKPL